MAIFFSNERVNILAFVDHDMASIETTQLSSCRQKSAIDKSK